MNLYKVTVSHDMIVCAQDEMEAADIAVEDYPNDIKFLPNLDASINIIKTEEIIDISQLPSTRSNKDKPFGRNEGLDIQQILDLKNFRLSGLSHSLSLKERFEIYQTLIKNNPSLKDKIMDLNLTTI